MTTIEELERRVTALETAQKETVETQTWMAGTLGRIAAVQDKQSAAIGDLREGVREIQADLKGLRNDLPSIIAETTREVLREERK